MDPEPLVSTVASSSPDEALIPASLSPPDDHRQYQELLQQGAMDLGILLEEIQNMQYQLLDIFQPQGPSQVDLSINDAIL